MTPFARIVIFLFLLLPFRRAGAQLVLNYTDPEVMVRAGQAGVEVLEDPQKQIGIDEVIRNKHPFSASARESLNFLNTHSRFWVHFTLNNATGRPLVIQFNNPELDDVRVYCVRNGKVITEGISGVDHPYRSRYYDSNKISLALGSDSADVYISLVTSSSFWCPIRVGTDEAISSANHLDDLFNGGYIGIMLVMLLYNLMIYFFIRDRIYLRYCLYLTCSFIMIFLLKGFHIDLLWRNHHTWNGYQNYFAALTTLSGIWFSVAFLNLGKFVPGSLNVLKVIFGAVTLGVILQFLQVKTVANLMIQTLGGITAVTLFILGILCYLRGDKEAKYYIIAWTSLLAGALTFVLMMNGMMPVNYITQNSFQMGGCLEAILLSFAMADRINTFITERAVAQARAAEQARENERLIREQNVMLETKVHERTMQLEDKIKLINLQNIEIEEKNERAEELLLNILPAEVANDLRIHGKYAAKKFENVTVMFADIVNFTHLGQELSAESLVEELDYLFKNFDEIISRYRIEKIKTIGDAYLCVGGLPVPYEENHVEVVNAALDIQEFMKRYRELRKEENRLFFEIRIGIDTGSVVAGIVGTKKFAYDVWGDTVNTAARMEQHSEKNRITISKNTYEKIQGRIKCSSRGFQDVKGKHKMELFFVDIPRSVASD
jgi:class 3 adenylate cyclase